MKSIFLFVCFFCVAVFSAAHAETLDDDSIRAIYAQADVAFKNPAELQKFMKKRLADNFVLNAETTYHVLGKDTKNNEIIDKNRLIDNMIEAGRLMDVKDYHHEVGEITYSDDKKFAYVKNATVLMASIKPVARGQLHNMSVLAQNQTGTDTLTLAGGVIKIVKTDRKNDLTFSQ